jgi:hypothetical protein
MHSPEQAYAAQTNCHCRKDRLAQLLVP